MGMKLSRTNRQAQKMRRRTLLIAAAAGSILGLIIVLFFALNIGNVRSLFAAGNTYYSRTNGEWGSASTWSTSSYGGSAAGSYPSDGDIVYIGGHSVTLTNANASVQEVHLEDNGNSATFLTINAGRTLTVTEDYTMEIGPSSKNAVTTLVSGSGAVLDVKRNLILTQENGKDEQLLRAIDGGKVLVAGNMAVTDKNGKENTVIGIEGASQLIISGDLSLTSQGGNGLIGVNMSGTSTLEVDGNIELDAQSAGTLQIEGSDNSTIILKGSIIRNDPELTAGSVTTTDNSQFILAGDGSQTMDESQAGSTDSMIISELRVDNLGTGSEVVLGMNVYVTSKLTLVSGTLISRPGAMLTLGPNATVSGGSGESFVSGPMKKVGTAAFTFPTGKGSVYAPISISAPSSSSTFSAEYFNAGYPTATTLNSGVAAVSQKEYWKLHRTGGTATPQVTLAWQDAGYSSISSTVGLLVARLDTTAARWYTAGASGLTGAAPGSGTVTSNAISNFGVLTFGSTTPTALPVSLIYFRAKAGMNTVDITWATATEINNDHFDIERSADGKKFEKIGTVQGSGNSQVKREYSYADKTPLPGTSYYRLRQVDLNGDFEVFPIQAVRMSTAEIQSVAPNPFTDRFTLNFELTQSANVVIELYTLTGEKVYSESMSGNAGSNAYRYDGGTNLSAGTYILHLAANGERKTTKITKSR